MHIAAAARIFSGRGLEPAKLMQERRVPSRMHDMGARQQPPQTAGASASIVPFFEPMHRRACPSSRFGHGLAPQ